MKSLIASLALFFGFHAQGAPTKVVLVIFENTSYSKALKQTYFKKFADSGALFTNYHALGHPSQGNYVGMVSGSMMGVTNDSRYNLAGTHLADLLESHGRSWHVYAEDFPGKCNLTMGTANYARKHNPLISFVSVQNNPTRCANISDASTFAADLKARRLADFTMYIPNDKNNGHDTGSAYASKWFEKTFAPLLADANAMQDMQIIATFDEDDGSNVNQVYTAIVGPQVKAGVQIASSFDHYSLLRTIEDIFQVGTLGRGDATAVPLTGYLK